MVAIMIVKEAATIVIEVANRVAVLLAVLLTVLPAVRHILQMKMPER